MDYQYVTLREKPQLMNQAAKWFHEKWNVEMEAYLRCMESYVCNESEYGWYLCLKDDQIIAGLGVVENDFHDRKDLTPNICAVYTEENFRCMSIAGTLLNKAVSDLCSKEIRPIYLVTNHIGFYEKYGWEFYCMVKCDNDSYLSRLYIYK